MPKFKGKGKMQPGPSGKGSNPQKWKCDDLPEISFSTGTMVGMLWKKGPAGFSAGGPSTKPSYNFGRQTDSAFFPNSLNSPPTSIYK